MNDSDIPGLPCRPNLIKEPKKRCTLFCKFFVTFLTVPLIVLVLFQVIAGLIGAIDLGGKYTSFFWLTYRVFSLVPAIAIGAHILLVCWLRKEYRFLRIFSKVFSIIYVVLFELAWFVFLYGRSPRMTH